MIKRVSPHITFRVNRNLDKRVAYQFIEPKNSTKVAGLDFMGYIFQMHPNLKKAIKFDNSKRKAYIASYIDGYYDKKDKVLNRKKEEFQRKWGVVENTFFDFCNSIFHDPAWPKGKYISFISIFNIGPRFLTTKTFQTYWQIESGLADQVIHELLHFKFYYFWDKNFKKIKLNDNQLWHLSEIFNDIMQSEKNLVKIQGYKPDICYPEHRFIYNKYKKIWNNSKKDMKIFIEKCIPEINKDFPN